MKYEFGMRFALCVTAGDGYEKNLIYPILGWNNGIHIARETPEGDVYDGCFCAGGIGDGCYNDWDETGSPSFVPVSVASFKAKLDIFVSE